MQSSEITVIAPVHNESAGIQHFVDVLGENLTNISSSWELILIDDGSSDNSWQKIQEISKSVSNVRGIKLSKNYGKDWAIQAGLRNASGKAVIVMDSDLQHPPEIISQLVQCWRQGFEIVIAKKTSRPDQSRAVKAGSNLWGKLFASLSGISIHNTTDFRLISSRAKDVIINTAGNRPFFRGDSSSIGLPTATVEFAPAQRIHGKTTFNMVKLFQLAVRSITSFTIKPLHFVTGLALITMFIAIILLLETFINWATQQAADGFTTVISIVLLLGSFQLLGIGIIGEYLGLIVENLDRKKEVIVETKLNFE